MKYRGIEIGRVPTIAVIQDYINRKNLPLSAEDIYKHYESMGWLTKKHKPIKSVEGIVDAWNGIRVMRESMNKDARLKFAEERVNKLMSIPNDKPTFYLRDEKDIAHYKYSAQLKDKRWQAFRDFVFTVRGNRCEKCGVKNNIQVHHLLYKKGCYAWEYTVNDVMVVCGDCHKKIHGL